MSLGNFSSGPVSGSANEYLEFGPFRLSASERELRRGDEAIPLTAKAFDVLHLLVRNGGRAIPKEEFMAAVWAGTAVEEGNLSDNISTLRQVLGDDARDPAYIQTLPRRGYRFIMPVRAVLGANAVTSVTATSANRPPLPRRAAWIAGLLLLGLIAAAAALWQRERTPPGAKPLRSIAVFPFDPLDPQAGETHLGVSLADSLITRLTNIEALTVRPASAVLGYKSSARDAITAAREQDVDAFVEGRIRKQGGRVRVTVQLVSVEAARTLWARTFDEDASNLFAVEDRIAADLAEELSLRVTPRERSRLVAAHRPDPEAYELYGAGRYLWSQRTPEALEKSVELFEQAIARDPRFALAHAGLADAHSAAALWNFRPPLETFPKAREAALAALRLDPELAEARASLAYVKFRYDWDFAGAGTEFRRAIAAKPNYATARVGYGEYLTVMQRFDEAAVELRRARELDPRSSYVAMMAAVRSYFMRDYPAAITQTAAILQKDSRFLIARELQWAAYREAGDDDRSVAARLDTLRAGAPPGEVETLRGIYERSGIEAYRGAENDLLQRRSARQYVPPVFVAMNCAENGDAAEAIQWLEKALAERSGWLVELRVDPVWDRIRDDPGFAALAARVFESAR